MSSDESVDDNAQRDNWLEAISDVSHRWGISFEDAESFLVKVEYSPPPHDARAVTDGGDGRLSCPECEHGTLRVSDAIYMSCDNCDASVEREEVGI